MARLWKTPGRGPPVRQALGMDRDTVITRENAADLFDFLLDPDVREADCLAALLLDDEGRVVVPIVVEDIPSPVARDDKDRAVRPLVRAAVEAGAAIAFAIGRDGPLHATDEDRDWHESLLATARAADVPVLGAWIAGGWGVRPLPRPLAEDALAG